MVELASGDVLRETREILDNSEQVVVGAMENSKGNEAALALNA
jgi:hypothetical protein